MRILNFFSSSVNQYDYHWVCALYGTYLHSFEFGNYFAMTFAKVKQISRMHNAFFCKNFSFTDF